MSLPTRTRPRAGHAGPLPTLGQVTTTPTRSRRIAVVASIVAALLAGLSVVGWRSGWLESNWLEAAPAKASDGTPSTVPAPTASPDAAAVRREGLRDLLSRRGAALTARDRAQWVSTADPSSPDFVQAQGEQFDNLGPVRFSSARFDFAGDGPALPAAEQTRLGPHAWVAKVVFAYRIADADVADVRREQYLTVVPRQGQWFVAGTSDGPAGVQRDLWELGPVFSARGTRSLVIGSSPEGLQDYAAMFDHAAERVDAVWGTAWPRTVVAIAPGTQTEMSMLLGRTDENGLGQIAAVTTGEVGLPVGEAADRVIVNPGPGLTEAGMQDVLTHEVTHVATRAAGPGPIPTWYSEGFADLVAYSDRDYGVEQTASQVLSSVADGGDPPGLPTQADFDPAQNPTVDTSYQAAYLAMLYLEKTYSVEAVTELYRLQAGAAGPGGVQSTPMPLDQALPAVTGQSVETFTQNYQDFVRTLARDGS